VTDNDALEILLARIAAAHEASVFLSDPELREWPADAVAAFKEAGLLKRASPARSATCDGCERQCSMPVEIESRGGASRAFIVCDKPEDIGRVNVPLDRLARWQASGEAVAAFLAVALGIARVPGAAAQPQRWDIGILRSRRAALVRLTVADRLMLEVAGHSVSLVEVLGFKDRRLELQAQRLRHRVDHPVAGGSEEESPAERRARLVARRDQLKRDRIRSFLKVIAKEEGTSVSRIKQLLAPSRPVSIR
jgi:hypothetical protein